MKKAGYKKMNENPKLGMAFSKRLISQTLENEIYSIPFSARLILETHENEIYSILKGLS